MEHIAHISCVVVAAGCGSRYGSPTPKQYLPIAGQPSFVHALERLVQALSNAGLQNKLRLLLVLHPDHGLAEELAGFEPRPVVISGGQTRQHSVRLALEYLSDHPVSSDISSATETGDHWILIHDGARPCVVPDDVEKLLTAVRGYDGGLLCYQLADSLFEISPDDNISDMSSSFCMSQAYERDRYRMAATPQIFTETAIKAAHLSALEQGWSGSDDASLAVRSGYRVVAVDSSAQNLKLTFRHDWASAESILQASLAGDQDKHL